MRSKRLREIMRILSRSQKIMIIWHTTGGYFHYFAATVRYNDGVYTTAGTDQNFAAIVDDDHNIYMTAGHVHDFAVTGEPYSGYCRDRGRW